VSTVLRAGDPALAFDPDLAAARRTLEAWVAPDALREDFRRRMLAFIDAHPTDAHMRTCREGHLTAAALVVDPGRTRVLLTHHRKLGRWLQLGGHLDGDANLAAGALREAGEESGIRGLAIEPDPIDLDIHTIPERAGDPAHLHLDVRFLVIAPEGAREVVSDESLELGWFTPSELEALDTDASVKRLARAVW